MGRDRTHAARYVLLLFGRVILQQFLHSLVQVLLVLFLVRTRVKRLGGISSPHELLPRWVIHIENQSSYVDCRTRGRRGSTPTDAVAHVVSVPLRLLTDRDLIGKIKISFVVIGPGHAFRRELRVDRLLDSCVHNLVRVLAPLDADPPVSVIFRKIRPRHEVVPHVLRGHCSGYEPPQQSPCQHQSKEIAASSYLHFYLPVLRLFLSLDPRPPDSLRPSLPQGVPLRRSGPIALHLGARP